MLIVNRHEPLGRLGNQLELATHLILFSILSNQRVNIPFDNKWKKSFPYLSENILNCFPRIACRWRSADRMARFAVKAIMRAGMVREIDLRTSQEWIYFDSTCSSPDHGEVLRRLSNSRLCAASLWSFRAASITDGHADAVRSALRPMPDVLDFGMRFRQSINADIVVGLHVRLGDFRSVFPDRIYSFQHYQDRLREIEDCFPGRHVGFIICSDEDVEQEFRDFIWAFPKGNPVQDIFALAQCDYIVGAPSTFSRWAAFWGNKKLCLLASKTQRIASLDEFKAASF